MFSIEHVIGVIGILGSFGNFPFQQLQVKDFNFSQMKINNYQVIIFRSLKDPLGHCLFGSLKGK